MKESEKTSILSVTFLGKMKFVVDSSGAKPMDRTEIYGEMHLNGA